MNRRSNKILRELILGNRQNILELVTKYNLQERTIRADIKDLNNTLQEYSLPLIVITGNGDLVIDSAEKIDVKAYEEFMFKNILYILYVEE